MMLVELLQMLCFRLRHQTLGSRSAKRIGQRATKAE